MIEFSLDQLTQPLDGVRVGRDVSFSSVATDTRTLAPGSLFVALEGPRFDGHEFVDAARERGAVAALVQRPPACDLPMLQVADTRAGLGRLGQLWRRASGCPLVAVTGSNGKTTVKEMIASILSRRGPVLSTEGNLNNEIGVPLTLTRLQAHWSAVVELGANHPGEIDCLSRIAAPNVAVITNAGRAHLEGFGSVEGVARAKAEILNGLDPDGWFIFNGDDTWAPLWSNLGAKYRSLTFGIHSGADVSCRDGARVDGLLSNRFTASTPKGEVEIDLPLPGVHNRVNALAAVAAAIALDLSLEEIRTGLAALPGVKGRLRPVAGRSGTHLIDDTYNANPDSVKAALELLAHAEGRRFVALGELAEMGAEEETFYRELGATARRLGIERLFVLAEAAPAASGFGPSAAVFEDQAGMIAALEEELRAGDWVLIKGSRKARMERVVEALTAEGMC